ncbi:MAG: hypothetical protein WAL90_20215 [Desulfobacterales bacterium]
MIIRSHKNFGLMLSIFCILGLISCGGGGGGGGGSGGDSVIVPTEPTGLTYTGVDTPAVIDLSNAVELTGDAFMGGETGTNLGMLSSVTDSQPNILREVKLYKLVPIFGGALNKIDFNSYQGDSLTVQTEQDAVVGDCGGSASYTATMDDVTGTFTGSMNFTDYCSQNTSISGTADFSGKFNVDNSGFLNFALSINMVSLTSGNQSYVIDGDISVDVSGPSTIASLDIVMKDSSNEVFWVNDYLLTITQGMDYVDLQVSGRFYHPTHGYVNLTTITPVRTYNIYQWPSSGELQVAGGASTTARLLVIDENYCQIIADTNGDGNYNYDSGHMYWNDL